MPDFLNVNYLIPTFGLVGIFFILILEAGLLIGVFLPGDSLLFVAGVFAYKGMFSFSLLMLICFLGTFLGDQLGFFLGKKYGSKIFSSNKSFFFNKVHLEKTENFFEKHGPKTILIARFIPVVRTGIPTLAGVGNMRYKTFLVYNTIGALVWTLIFTTLGYIAGRLFKGNIHVLGYITFSVILVSVVWGIVQVLKAKKK